MKLSLIRVALAFPAFSVASPAWCGQGNSAAPPHAAPVMMERMTTAEVREAIKGGKTTVLIPNASTEATGPAIALGKHIVRAQYLGEHIAKELGNALVAPIMPFAPTTDESRFAGTVNLSAETFSRVNEEVAESMVKAGFKSIILMGDHDANQPPLRALAGKLDEKHRSQGVRVFFSSDAYAKTNKEIEDYLKANGYPPSRHGGIPDTSLTWAVDPDYVRPDRIVVGAPVPPAGSPLSLGAIGVEGDPRRSSPDLGKMFLTWKVRNGVAEIRKLVGGAAK
jgi:creatinine amidohydrolase/Fe(II)-dependent formamide hydrolase-like protein